MKNVLLLFILLFTTITFAQDKQTQSKELYATALKAYENNEYKTAFSNLQKAIEIGGGTNKYIEVLKVNCYIAQRDWANAKYGADNLFKSLPKDEVLNTLSLTQLQINAKYEKKLEKELQDKIESINNKFQKTEYQLEIVSELDNLPTLKEGYAYLVNVSETTVSSSEKNIFIYYGNKYIIFTIPSTQVFKDIFNVKKNKVIYKPTKKSLYSSITIEICDVNDGCIIVKTSKTPKSIIKKGKVYDNSYYTFFGNGYMGVSDRDLSATIVGAYYYSILEGDLNASLTYFDDYDEEKSAVFDDNINRVYKNILS